MMPLRKPVLDLIAAIESRCCECEVEAHATGIILECSSKEVMGRDTQDFWAEAKVSGVAEAVRVMVKDGLLERGGESLVMAGTKITVEVKEMPIGFVSQRVRETAPKGYAIEIATMLKGKGYAWVERGFLKRDATATGPTFYAPKNERDFFAFIGMPWTEPKLRKFGSVYPKRTRVETVTVEQMREWVAASRWTDSKQGGEAHQFTVRVAAADDELFAGIMRTIHRFGYRGEYQGKVYRYLDLDGWFYFTQGYKIEETQLVNRKRLVGSEARPERAWKLNPVPLKLLTMRVTAR